MSNNHIQESLTPTVKEKVYKEESTELYQGANLSPTNIVKIIPLYESYGHLPPISQKECILEYKQKSQEKTKEEFLLNARYAIYGTLIHNLEYFTEIFHERTNISIEYLETVFPRQERKKAKSDIHNKDDIYYLSLIKLQDLVYSEYGISDDVIDNAINFWNMWRLNGQDFKPQNKDGAILSAFDIKKIWESDSVPLQDIETFKENFKKHYKENTSQNIYERMFGRNINFKNGNLKTTSFVDKISIPYNYPEEPIKIIDFKTGKQFKYPTKAEKLQIFLMSISAYCNLIDSIDKKVSSKKHWDMVHDTPSSENLRIISDDLLSNKRKMYTPIWYEEIAQFYDNMAKKVIFSYINPLTQDEIKIDLKKDLGLNNYGNVISLLKYIEELNYFYIKNKNELEPIINTKNPAFLLPKFPIKDFYKDNYVQKEIAIQQSFF